MTIAGKTIVVTGASSGIGAAAARKLASQGAVVVPVGRSASKTAEIARELGVEPLTADYASLNDVRRLAAELLDRCPRIDVLANNAGGLWTQRIVTGDGNEQTFQVNTLAPFLLTRLLVDRLRESGGRVVNTSTMLVAKADLDLNDLDTTGGKYHPHQVYNNSKLGAALLIREFSRRYPQVPVADFHPGIIASEFARDMKLQQLLMKTPLKRPLRRLLKTPEQGAETLVYLATTTRDGLSNRYYVESKPGTESAKVKDQAKGGRLWDISSERVGLAA
jgi:NAD(P)-dependent dehydrogenase (short-subunit alcohol dehydrogenase family)